MNPVLVTGGSGFIGRQVVDQLVSDGHDVHATHYTAAPTNTAATWHRVDLLDEAARRDLISSVQPRALLHLAWDVSPGEYVQAPSNIDWAAASLRLVRFFQEEGGERFVGAGTCFEYAFEEDRLDERTSDSRPNTLYGTAKDAVRRILEMDGATHHRSVAWGRIFHLYGPHEHPGRLVSSVTKSLLAKQPALCSSGEQRRDFLHVRDVAGAFVALLASDVVGTVNIGSGRAVTVRSVIETLGRLTDASDLLRIGVRPRSVDDPPVIEADSTRLREEVGWTPRRDLEEGLRDTVEWWKEQV